MCFIMGFVFGAVVLITSTIGWGFLLKYRERKLRASLKKEYHEFKHSKHRAAVDQHYGTAAEELLALQNGKTVSWEDYLSKSDRERIRKEIQASFGACGLSLPKRTKVSKKKKKTYVK